jgi:uncharacterized protein YegP (UPF0339 family)
VSKFEIYKGKNGETRFRYRASNGEIMFSSEGYKAKASAVKAIESLKKNIVVAGVEEIADAPQKAPVKTAAAKTSTTKAPAKAAKPAAKAAAKPASKAKTAAKAPAKKAKA